MSESLTLFDIVPGREIADRYTVVGAHRQGGFSTTFEVTDGADGSSRELQLFPLGLFEGRSQTDQFRAKLTPWLEVDSGHVNRLRDVLRLDTDILGLVSDLPSGEALRARLQRETRLAPEEVVAIGCGLLAGLVEIHGRGLVHGDVKPYTIWVDGTGADTHTVLLDGGVTLGLWTAKDLGDKTTLIGTPYYAPIEQFGGDPPDVRSDVYNAATVLFECAAGVLPWAGTSFLEVFQAKLSDPPSMAERAPGVEVDARLEEVVRKGCLADRHDRYPTAAAFLEAFRGLEG